MIVKYEENKMTPQKISIIGCGRVGTALAVFLSKAGYNIAALTSRTRSSAEKTATAIRSVVENSSDYNELKISSSAVEAAKAGDIIFITTPDNLIERVCYDLSSNIGVDMAGKTLFHCSGALSSCVLASAADNGADTGSIHPLQSFAPYSQGEKSPFKGINISVEGSQTALAIGKELINALEANQFTIPTNAKTLYHAAAVVASNYLVTVENFAIELLKEAGIDEQKGYEILEPLIQGTLNNIKTKGAVAALTGPVARGDISIVEKHLIDINEKVPEFSTLYRIIGQYTLKLAEKRGELDQISIKGLTDIFY